jgi:hypothetical protein
MNRVPTKITQKIRMLLKHPDIHAHTRQQKAQHHPGGSASGNAAASIQRVHANLIACAAEVSPRLLLSFASFIYRFSGFFASFAVKSFCFSRIIRLGEHQCCGLRLLGMARWF